MTNNLHFSMMRISMCYIQAKTDDANNLFHLFMTMRIPQALMLYRKMSSLPP